MPIVHDEAQNPERAGASAADWRFRKVAKPLHGTFGLSGSVVSVNLLSFDWVDDSPEPSRITHLVDVARGSQGHLHYVFQEMYTWVKVAKMKYKHEPQHFGNLPFKRSFVLLKTPEPLANRSNMYSTYLSIFIVAQNQDRVALDSRPLLEM